MVYWLAIFKKSINKRIRFFRVIYIFSKKIIRMTTFIKLEGIVIGNTILH